MASLTRYAKAGG